jgi:hypothetical protein
MRTCSGVSLSRRSATSRGSDLDAGTGLKGAHLRGAHLRLPGGGDEGPTQEVFTYDRLEPSSSAAPNRPGFGHIAFEVENVAAAREEVLIAGGGTVGEIVTLTTTTGAKVTWCYVTAGYKALTGRAHPAHGVGTDLTHTFRFGLLRGGVFWGWPSSHTTIAFAMALTVFTLYPKRRWLGWLAIAYAFYIGLGVSMTIHWFSDFAAGAII